MDGEEGTEDTGITLELLERLRPYLAESLMVLNPDWTIRVNLAPPGGLIGQGLGLGFHTLENMHPDDAVQVMELGAQAFTTEPGWSGSKIVRMERGDGTYGRYEVFAVNLLDDPVVAGMVVRTREVPVEVSDHLNGLDPSSTIETVAELLPIGLLLLDHHARVVFANQAACDLVELGESEIKRAGLEALIDQRDHVEVNTAIERLVATPGRHDCTVRLATERSERVQCQFSTEGSSLVTRIVVTLEDVTERHAAQLDLEQQAYHDSLTGLRNRRSILTLIQQRLDRRQPTSVAYLDLDGFKVVNDTWGHERGDQLLVDLARSLRNEFDETTEIARIGGDEFLVVSGHVEDVHALVDRLHHVVDSVTRSDGLAVTGSVGTTIAGPGDSPRDLLRRADLKMYSAKGRRR